MVLLVSARLFSVLDGISILFYGAGTLTELSVTILLAELVKRDYLSADRMRLLEYLNRVVIGLPMTIYLLLTGPHSSLGAARFLVSLTALPARRNPAGYIWFIVFFTAGSLTASALVHDNIPSENHIFTVVNAMLASIVMVAAQRAVIGARRARSESRRKSLHHERRGNRLSLLQNRLFSVLLPAPQDRIAAEGRDVRPDPGVYLVAALSFPGLDEAAADSPAEFARDWDRFLIPVTDRLREAGYFTVHAGRFVHAAMKTGPETLRAEEWMQDSESRAKLVEGIAALFDLLTRAREMSAIRVRNGHAPWGLEIALALGPAVGLPSGGGDPSWIFRGSTIRRAEKALGEWTSGKMESVLRLWVEEALWGVVRPLVQGDGAVKDGWKSTGLLRVELSKDGKGEEPAADFLTRVRYAGLIGND